ASRRRRIPPGPAPATQPATRPAQPAAVLLAHRAGEWTRVAPLDESLLAPEGRAYLADVPGKGLFLLACDPAGWPIATFRCDVEAGTWTKMEPLDWQAGHRVGWWMTAGADLLAAGLSDGGPWLRRVDPRRGTLGDPAPLTHDGEPLPVETFDAMSLAPFKLTLAAAWRADDTWRLGTADVRGGEITDVDPMDVPSGATGQVRLDRWLQGLFILTAIIAAIMVVRRLKGTAASGFTLPVDLVPALWPLRMLAAALDALPLMMAVSFVGSVLFPDAVERLPQRLSDMVTTEIHDPLIGWLTLAWGIAYLLYGIVMEAVFGATPAKMLFRMRVVGAGAGRPPLIGVILRNLTKPLELMLPLVFLVWPLLSAYRQRAGDMLGGTAVVTRASLESLRGPAGGASERENRLGPPPPPPPE
ncbi:MAG: RDD family protein, partial [Planctomycetota bacterium]